LRSSFSAPEQEGLGKLAFLLIRSFFACGVNWFRQARSSAKAAKRVNIAGSQVTKKCSVPFNELYAEVAARRKTGENICGTAVPPIGFQRRARSTMTLIILLLGLGVGVLVGLLGIGGGVVLVPAMVYLLGMDQHLAQGTSLFILLPPIGLGALVEYWKQGQVDLKAGILCALGILVGAYAGSLIALPIASRNLKGLFGCFLVLAAILLLRKAQLESGQPTAEGERIHG
jgi:uncharacterized protein